LEFLLNPLKILVRTFSVLICISANLLNGQSVGDSNSSGLSTFEKAELRRLLDLDFLDLSRTPIRGVLGYEQEHWKNPASVHVIRPEDISLNGHVLMVDSFRNVAGMHATRGVGYDDFVTMRNFSGSATEKFLTMVDGREVLQIMGGTINWTTEDVPLAILDRVEIIRGPGASIWGTNSVSGVVNVVTKHAAQTQGDSVRLIIENDGTFLGEYVHGGQISDDTFYRFWVRDQEYSEGKLISGMDARDDGYARKAGFRFDKELGSNLDLTIAGGFATRRVDHVLDLSYRLFYINNDIANPYGLTPGTPAIIPIGLLPDPTLLNGTNWSPFAVSGDYSTIGGYPRYQNYEEMPQDGSHLRAKLSGITDNDLEWSVAGYAELYDTSLGHIGHSWEREEFDLDFRANRPWGEKNHIAFGLAAKHLSLDVQENVTPPWNFLTFDTIPGTQTLTSATPASNIPIIDYHYQSNPTKYDRVTGFVQNSTDINEKLSLSLGAKFEDSDLSGSSVQPGARISYLLDEGNILWGAYSRAYRQASLVEQYSKVSYARFYDPTNSVWVNQSFAGNPSLSDETMDAYELGWRTRPSDKLLIELSLYHYSTEDAVFSGPPVYTTSDVKTTGGELTFDYRASHSWHLQGGYSYSKGKKDGVKQDDFPESMANLSSHLKLMDDLTFIQSLYYTGDRTIPSAYNPIPIDDYLRLDLGFVWQAKENWEIGLFGRDLLDPGHAENMYNDLDVEPGRVERTFLLSITKKF
jgi:outer membrane receptor protein involved in Fe transport